MYLGKEFRRIAASALMAGLSVSAWALTPGSGTWVKDQAGVTLCFDLPKGVSAVG